MEGEASTAGGTAGKFWNIHIDIIFENPKIYKKSNNQKYILNKFEGGSSATSLVKAK